MRLEIEEYAEDAAASLVSPPPVYFPKVPDVSGESVVTKRKTPILPVMFGYPITEHHRGLHESRPNAWNYRNSNRGVFNVDGGWFRQRCPIRLRK